METGISIFYRKDTSPEITKLFYFQSFTGELFLLLLLLPLLLGSVFYIFQMKEQNWFNYVYNFYVYFFKIELLELIFLGGMTIIVTLYTAKLTDVLAGQKKFGEVNTIDDLRGVRIAANFLFKDRVKNIGGRYVEQPSTTHAFEDADPYKTIGE